MGLNAKEVKGTGGGGDFQPSEAGTYPGRLVWVVDLGIQPQRPYKGQDKPPAQQVTTVYELVDEFMLDGDGNEDRTKPKWMWETFVFHNLDMDLATSTKRYKALDPNMEENGDWSKLIGRPVNVTITAKEDSKGNIWNNVSATSTMRSKDLDKVDKLVNEPLFYTPDAHDQVVFDKLPKKTQELINNRLDEDSKEEDEWTK